MPTAASRHSTGSAGARKRTVPYANADVIVTETIWAASGSSVIRRRQSTRTPLMPAATSA